MAREDEAIYADDTNLIIEHDAPVIIASKLHNYPIPTISRPVGIQWEK